MDEVGVAGTSTLVTCKLLPYALTVIWCGLSYLLCLAALPSSMDAERLSKLPICLFAELAMDEGVEGRNFEVFEAIERGRLGTANCGGLRGGFMVGIGFGAKGFIFRGCTTGLSLICLAAVTRGFVLATVLTFGVNVEIVSGVVLKRLGGKGGE